MRTASRTLWRVSVMRSALPDLTPPELTRYARHLALPEVGSEGQRTLKGARVALVGAGGLGSPAAMYLAAAGVGTLGLIDFDEVEATNLQRQILFGTGDVGRAKLDSARDRLAEINPHVELVLHELRLSSANALEILGAYDIVLDGTDNFPTRYLVNDACVLLGKPNVYGSILRWDGQVSLFATESGPCYRCLFRDPPPPGLVPNCAEGGVLGVLPGVIGSLQALEAIKWILGVGDSLAGRLLIFDGLELTWREVRVPKNSNCPVCSENPTQTVLIDYEDFCGLRAAAATVGSLPELSATELKARLGGDDAPFLLDVREPFEWEIANLGEFGAVLIPLSELESRITEIPTDRAVTVYCRSGGRSARAVRRLADAGFERAENLRGGILAWAEEIDPELPRY
jgi:sulfur-carrier protein adenylyltransferase/sulfurtransferase